MLGRTVVNKHVLPLLHFLAGMAGSGGVLVFNGIIMQQEGAPDWRQPAVQGFQTQLQQLQVSSGSVAGGVGGEARELQLSQQHGRMPSQDAQVPEAPCFLSCLQEDVYLGRLSDDEDDVYAGETGTDMGTQCGVPDRRCHHPPAAWLARCSMHGGARSALSWNASV